jgi:hypothetical protein
MKRLELTRFLLKRLTQAHYLLHDRRDTRLCFSAYEIVKLLFRHHGINLTLCRHKEWQKRYTTTRGSNSTVAPIRVTRHLETGGAGGATIHDGL